MPLWSIRASLTIVSLNILHCYQFIDSSKAYSSVYTLAPLSPILVNPNTHNPESHYYPQGSSALTIILVNSYKLVFWLKANIHILLKLKSS